MMKIDVEKCIIINIYIVMVSCTFFQKHIQPLIAKLNKLFGKQTLENKSTKVVGKIEHDSAAVSQCNNSNDNLNYFGIDWKNINTNISKNWLIFAVFILVTLIMFWSFQYNIRNRLQEWKKLFVQKEKTLNYSRRPTLPDLTLAKHARRESLAEATLKITNGSRQLSQFKNSHIGNMKQNMLEINDDTSMDTKRVHKIRRRF